MRDVAENVPIESAALAKDVFRYLQSYGEYLIEHPG